VPGVSPGDIRERGDQGLCAAGDRRWDTDVPDRRGGPARRPSGGAGRLRRWSGTRARGRPRCGASAAGRSGAVSRRRSSLLSRKWRTGVGLGPSKHRGFRPISGGTFPKGAIFGKVHRSTDRPHAASFPPGHRAYTSAQSLPGRSSPPGSRPRWG
jgi:hypothetical protein